MRSSGAERMLGAKDRRLPLYTFQPRDLSFTNINEEGVDSAWWQDIQLTLFRESVEVDAWGSQGRYGWFQNYASLEKWEEAVVDPPNSRILLESSSRLVRAVLSLHEHNQQHRWLCVHAFW